MEKSFTIEKVFIDLCDALKSSDLFYDDLFDNSPKPMWSFYDLISEDKPLTKNQADYVIKILKQYRDNLQNLGYDLEQIIQNPTWKHPFRIIDQTRKISVEQDEDGIYWLCFQFPYSLKEDFDNTFGLKNVKYSISKWDADKKLRKIRLYHLNFIEVDEYVNKNSFILDESYIEAKSQIEEILNSVEDIEKKSVIIDGEVYLKNACDDTLNFFENKKTKEINKDLFLSKKMGFSLDLKAPSNIVEKICSTENNTFWTKNIESFFDLYLEIKGKTAIILDKDMDYRKWINQFISYADLKFISRSEIKICFREDKKNSDFNSWIRENGLGGKVSNGSIYIFLNQPAKWLYEELDSVNIIAMTDLIPNTNKHVQNLLVHHPLVLYINEKKPTALREIKIVNL